MQPFLTEIETISGSNISSIQQVKPTSSDGTVSGGLIGKKHGFRADTLSQGKPQISEDDDESFSFEDSPILRQGAFGGEENGMTTQYTEVEEESVNSDLENLRKKVIIYDAKFKIPNAQRDAINKKNMQESNRYQTIFESRH